MMSRIVTSLHVQYRMVPLLLVALLVVLIYGYVFFYQDPVRPVLVAWGLQYNLEPGISLLSNNTESRDYSTENNTTHDIDLQSNRAYNTTENHRSQQSDSSESADLTNIGKSSPSQLTKKKNFLFLKTHKCGTSSVVNLFYLFGVRHRSNFVIHRGPLNHYLHLNEVKKRPLLAPRPGQQYNIQCQHGTFYPEIEHMIMPKETSLYTTIIRSTVSHFKSAFSFFGAEFSMRKRLGEDASIDELITGYLNSKPPPTNTSAQLNTFVNSMALDLGFGAFAKSMPGASLEDKITAFLAHLDRELDLVMLTDRMDESLVLLKEYLGWKLSDIVYLKRMVSKKPHVEMSEDVQALIRRYNVVDDRIYEHFSPKFEQHVERLGRENIAKQVQEFQEMRERFEDKCFDKDKVVKLPYNSVSWAISDWGRTENLACTFLQARDTTLTKVMAELQHSEDYFKPIPGKSSFKMRETVEKIKQDFDEGADPV